MHPSFLFIVLVALTGLGSALQAQPADGPSRLFTGRDLFSLQVATDPQLRPDGAVIAYARVSHDIMQDRPVSSIWLVDVATGHERPVAAVGGADNSNPRWSPDGKRLAFVSARAGSKPQIFVQWQDTGVTAKVTDLVNAPGQLEWSPDGSSIAFIMLTPDDRATLGRAPPKPEGAQWAEPLEVITDVTYRADGAGYLQPGFRHAYVVAASGGAPRQLTFGEFNEGGPLSWARDGQSLYLTGNRTEGWRREPFETEIYRVSLRDSTIEPVTKREGPDRAPMVSPDGTQLAYLGFDDRYLGYQGVRLYVMDLATRQTRSLTDDLDRSIDAARWSPDGRGLVASYADHGVTKLVHISLNGRREVIAEGLTGDDLDRPYTGGEFSLARNGTVAFTRGSPQAPSDVAVLHQGKIKSLTRLNATALADKTMGAVQPLAVTSSFDKRPIDAWVVMPPGFDRTRKYPLILEIHGGPFAAYGPTFSTDNQLYAAAGYVVVYSNPRGSTSYGEEFANLIHHDYPSHDYDDLMSVVDAVIAEGYIDANSLFVTGGSGGGLLTAWIVGRTPRFRAAATQKPVINWSSQVLTTDVYTFMAKYWFGKMPWEDPQAYWRRSPLSLVGNVTTPTLVVVGDQDLRTPVSDSEQYFQALQLRGVPTALVKVPGASHGGLTARPSQSAAKTSAILAWFERYRVAGD